jgi:tetratricopeptide (TPR) repeat protein
MKRVLIPALLISSLAISCAKYSTSDNSNLTNVYTQTASSSETNQANTGAKTEETPLPIFTDANEAVAVADKLFDQSDNEKAIEAYRQAVKLNPDFAEAYFKLGMAYSQLEIEQRNAGVLTEEEPTPTPTKKGKKDIQPKLSDADKAFESAVKAYKKILDKDPKDDAAHFNLGRAYNKLNEDTDAQKALREAVKLKPDDGLYQTELGAILIKLAHYDEAVVALKKAVEIDAENLQAQDLLEKAQAGKKRIDFGVKQKLQSAPPQTTSEQGKTLRETAKPPRESAKTPENPKPKEEPTPEKEEY